MKELKEILKDHLPLLMVMGYAFKASAVMLMRPILAASLALFFLTYFLIDMDEAGDLTYKVWCWSLVLSVASLFFIWGRGGRWEAELQGKDSP